MTISEMHTLIQVPVFQVAGIWSRRQIVPCLCNRLASTVCLLLLVGPSSLHVEKPISKGINVHLASEWIATEVRISIVSVSAVLDRILESIGTSSLSLKAGKMVYTCLMIG